MYIKTFLSPDVPSKEAKELDSPHSEQPIILIGGLEDKREVLPLQKDPSVKRFSQSV